ncbi:type II toxin-antitoxin system tRNA(fMet)-specific endonuclease VapC [Thiothrix eikelboomii]|uniref:type II toxin-antitoxin system tRNA(fMet)-specific endonuclease VapC n=1 Tax=Thiothrix eikelboomii TaxID=92487 RepID=UPI003BAEECC0
MKLYMLDTDTSSYIIKNRPESVRRRLAQVKPEQLCISIITYAELLYGVERSSSQQVNHEIVMDFVRRLLVQTWDEAAAEVYAKLRADLERVGQPIRGMDMQIAAHALSLQAILVTNNTRHFERVSGLVLENWVE